MPFYPIRIEFETDCLLVNQHRESFRFLTGSSLSGKVSLVSNDGPMGIREFKNPSYLEVQFEFSLDEKFRLHHGLLPRFDLWFKNGSAASPTNPEFVSHSGPIDGLMDDREEASYILPDGRKHAFRVKYVGCTFDVMVDTKDFVIRCHYYDATIKL